MSKTTIPTILEKLSSLQARLKGSDLPRTEPPVTKIELCIKSPSPPRIDYPKDRTEYCVICKMCKFEDDPTGVTCGDPECLKELGERYLGTYLGTNEEFTLAILREIARELGDEHLSWGKDPDDAKRAIIEGIRNIKNKLEKIANSIDSDVELFSSNISFGEICETLENLIKSAKQILIQICNPSRDQMPNNLTEACYEIVSAIESISKQVAELEESATKPKSRE